MIILSEGATGQKGPVVAAKPQVVRFDHRGIRFALDANTLKLAVLENEKDEDLEHFGAPLKPNFQLGCPPAPGSICFDVTRACNLRCTYCFAQHDDERNNDVHLSVDDAVTGLSLLLPKNIRNGSMRNHRIQYSFFGGEPLTRWDFIEKMVQHIEAWVPCVSHFHVTTNGTLLTKEMAEFMELHGFSTIVSLDGTEKAHDECRVRAGGGGSYAATIEALKLLRKYAPNVVKKTTLRSTFTPTSILTESIADRVAHLNDLVEQGLGSYVSVEPAFLGEHTCANSKIVEEQAIDYTKFREEWQARYDEASDAWLERLKQGKPCHYHHFISFAKRMVNSLPNCTECGAAKGYYTIAPGGELFACHHEGGTRVGNIATGGVDSELAARWVDNRYYARLKCPECPIRNICGGGCREYSVSKGLGVSMPEPSECELKWILVRCSAWLAYKVLTDPALRDKGLAYWGLPNRTK